MEQTNQKADATSEGRSFSIKHYLQACGHRWKWFAVSVIIIVGLAYLYVIRKQPVYEREMSVLVKDQNGGGGMADIAGAFSSLGLVSTNTNVANELIALLSPAVMAEVVERLQLDVNYLERGFPHGTTLYGTNQPFVVKFLDLATNQAASFRYEANPDGSGRLYKFRIVNEEGKVQKFDKEISFRSGTKMVNTPVGRIQFTPNQRYTGQGNDETVIYVVQRTGFMPTVEKYQAKLKGDLADKDAEVINLSIKDVSTERAVDILNTVLDVYTEMWVQDKNRMAVATSKFIDERLNLIQRELGGVDRDIMEYRSEHLIGDFQEAAKVQLASVQQNKDQYMDIATELEMARFVRDYVKKPANINAVIPINTGAVSNQLEMQIGEYNSRLLARNTLEESTSATNPLVLDYDAQLKGMRDAIVRSLDNRVVKLEGALRNNEREQSELRAEMTNAPKQANQLLGVERQQKVKESLYLFLLQKREENELNQTFTADNTRVITPPMGSHRPVSPKKGLMLAVAFIIGLALPAGMIYAREAYDTKIRSRKDLEFMATPYVGEIPYVGKRKKISLLKKLLPSKKKKFANRQLETLDVRVERGSRDVINESFRIVRGNIDFLMRSDAGHVIMVTSFNPGSGKSFVTFNLGLSFALKDKKVLIIDCDLRHGSSSQYVGMPSKGITSYLTGHTADWHKLVVPIEENLSVLPIGTRPPNPAELLDSFRMKSLLAEASRDFDYVLLDCPPVDVVVDTQILAPMADRTVFVVRAGLLEKNQVKEIDELFNSHRFKQMSIVLNGTEGHFSRYGVDSGGYYSSDYYASE